MLAVRFFPWLLVSLLVPIGACEHRCNKNVNVGGGAPTMAVAVHVRLGAADAWVGGQARAELAELLGLDPHIVAQTQAGGAVDVLVGVGKGGVEIYSAMVATPNAEAKLGERFALEPLMFQQLRIKPPRARARCMLIRDHLACASADARLGRGVLAADRYARASDGGVGEGFSVRVVASTPFAEHVLPLLRSHLERGMTRSKTSQRVRELVLGNWEAVAHALSNAHVIGRLSGDEVTLSVSLPVAMPALWLEGDGSFVMQPRPGFVAASWYAAKREKIPGIVPFSDVLGAGRARAIRIRDGAEVAIYQITDAAAAREAHKLISPSLTRIGIYPGALMLSKSDEIADAVAVQNASPRAPVATTASVAATASVDLRAVGGAGDVFVAVERGADGGTDFALTMTRATFKSLWHVLTATWPTSNEGL